VIRAPWTCLIVLGALLAPLRAPLAAPAPPSDTPPDSLNADWSRVPEYRLVPGDELVLNFGLSASSTSGFLDRTVIVRPDGRISVFPIGDVVAAGHTPRELEAVLVDLLSANLKQPRVTVEVSKIAGNQVHVLGRVDRPGSYPAEPFLTVMQAVAAAGGFKDDAARNSVLVFHRLGAREASVAVIAVDKMLKRGSLAADLPLSRFDIVYVPRNTIGNVSVFAQQLFAPFSSALSTSLVGWELFNLDRVYRAVPTR
jgi:polysaccharide export outer membrane protein